MSIIFLQKHYSQDTSAAEKFLLEISQNQLYDENSSTVSQLLKDISETQYSALDLVQLDNEWKYVLDFTGTKGRAILKPMRYRREEAVSFCTSFMKCTLKGFHNDVIHISKYLRLSPRVSHFVQK